MPTTWLRDATELSNACRGAKDEETVARTVAAALVDQFGATRARCWRCDDEGAVLAAARARDGAASPETNPPSDPVAACRAGGAVVAEARAYYAPVLRGGSVAAVLEVARSDGDQALRDAVELAASLHGAALDRLALGAQVDEEKQRLRSLLMQAPAAIAVVRGPDHVYELSNARNDELAGRPIPTGRPARDVLPELASQGLLALLDEVYRSGAPFVGKEIRLELGEGDAKREVWIDGIYQPVRDERGTIDSVLAFAYDVTNQVEARRRAEALARDLEQKTRDLEESEARARRLEESGVIGVVRWTIDGDIVGANDAFLAMVGYTREDVAAGRLRWSAMTPPEWAAADARALAQMLEHGVSAPFEKEYVHRDGHRVPILIGVAAWEGTRSSGVAWILDISDRKRLERQREEAVAAYERKSFELQSLIDHAPAAIFMKDLDGRFILVNRAAAAVVGRTPEAVLGRTDTDFLPAEVARAFREGDREVLARGAPVEIEEEAFVGSDRRVAHTVKFPVRDATGAVYATGGFSIDITERRKLETALRKQSLLSETLTTNATSALVLLDANQECTFMNPAAEAMTGFTLAEVLGKRLHDLVHQRRPDGRPYPREECPIDGALSGRGKQQGEDFLIRKDGSFFPVAYTASSIVEGGEPAFAVIELRDITEERQRSDAVRLQAHVLHSMAEGVSVCDDAGIIVYTNAAEDAMFGYARGELTGLHVTVQNAYPPEENDRRVREVMAHLRTHGAWSGEWLNVRKDGTPFFTRARITAIEQSGRRHFVCVQTDVTDEKRVQEEQAFLEALSLALGASLDLERIVESVMELAVPEQSDWCALYFGAPGGELTLSSAAHVEPALADVLRATPRLAWDEVIGPGPRELLATLATSDYLAAPLVVHGRTVGAMAFGAAEALRGDQPPRRFDARARTLLEEVGRRVAVAIDNARLLETAERERRRAEEANRAKDELLSVTSHELRTPLNAILGWTRLLRSGAVDENKRAGALETIERNARVQVQLVDDILDVSRVITGKLRLEVTAVDPAHVVEQAVEVIRPAADAKGVHLHLIVDPDAGTIRGDSARLQQICWNLLSNAVKFTPRGGRVHVHLRRAESNVELAVTDSGKGIGGAFLAHVFEPFRQEDGSITRVHGGLGLGLAIVKHLVELHGGRVEATSEGADKGATFSVLIPVASIAPSARSSSGTGSVPADADVAFECPSELEGTRVLLVDDEQDARELVESVLTRCRARVATAASAAEAFAAFVAEPPDILISDIGMGRESGYDLIRRVRALDARSGGAVPAVALTAYASSADRTRALLEGFTAHAGKPTDPAELVAVLASLLRR